MKYIKLLLVVSAILFVFGACGNGGNEKEDTNVKLPSCVKNEVENLFKIVSKIDEKFDVVYIDPPYFSGIYDASLDVVKNIYNETVDKLNGKSVFLNFIKEKNFQI